MQLHRCLVLFFLLSVTWSVAQQTLRPGNSFRANAVDAEKVYLQLTGEAFNTSEVVWFKAIVANAYDNAPSKVSGVLHVELIDPMDEQIVDDKLLKLENGIAESFFQLHGNYPEGKYLIRAYTEWNKNFGEDFIFSTYIDVFHFKRPEDKIDPVRDITLTKDHDKETITFSSMVFPNELDSLYKGRTMLYLNWEDGTDSIEIKQKRGLPVPVEYTVASDVKTIAYRLKMEGKSYSKSIVLDENSGSLDFFPEGGALVNDLKSIVGFKYLNYKGKGAEIEGVIVDQEDNELSTFKSNPLGMGSIQLRPESGKSYFGVVRSKDGTMYRYPIPAAKAQGTVMRLISMKQSKLIVLRAKPALSDSIYLKLYHRGKDVYMVKALMKKGIFNYPFNKDNLPNGLIGATLYDSKHRPVAERHFYNHRPEENLEIKVEMDKKEYEVRDSVSVSIRSTKGKRSTPSSISLMAVSKDYYEQTNRSLGDIVSYFRLQSDIRGEIEKPSYYFEHEDRLKDLDYLMLTQGWTNYKYDKPTKPKIVPPEKGLKLAGYVGGVQNMKKTKRSQNETFSVSLMTFGEKVNTYYQEIDGTGYFDFDLEESYGDGKKFVVKPNSSDQKSTDFKVRTVQRKIPEIAYRREVVIAPVDSVIERSVNERIVKDIALDPYLLPNTIELDEAVVSDYELTPQREAMKKLHGLPDVVVDNKELLAKKEDWTSSLFSWLLYNYPQDLWVRRVGGANSFLYASVRGADFTYIVIDGQPIWSGYYRIVPDIPLRAVKSVEILKTAGNAYRYFCDVFPRNCIAGPPPASAILAIYTYAGKGLFGAFPGGTDLVLDSTPEFSPTREFYSPSYDGPDADSSTPDLRTVLHWEPNVITDTYGNATVKFFNGDIAGKVLVICEGISIAGEGLGRTETAYDIIE